MRGIREIIKNKLLILIGIVFFCACDSAVVYEENVSIAGNNWHRKDTVIINVPIADTTLISNIYINVRNSGNYKYSNLFLFIKTVAPNGAFVRDTFDCILAEESGTWKGSGIGDIWSCQIPYKKNIRFPRSGIYSFAIEQGMRDKELSGILDIGVRVEKIN